MSTELDSLTAGIVLGLPRGGVPVAAKVAEHLGLPLDVFLVRKLGVPGHEELAMGALATGGVSVLNDDVIRRLGVDDTAIRVATDRELRELRRRERLYRFSRPPLDLVGRDVILIDDGLATGASLAAAIKAVGMSSPSSVTVGVPVAPMSTASKIRLIVDRFVVVHMPAPFFAVGSAYRDFTQTRDEEVCRLLDESTIR